MACCIAKEKMLKKKIQQKSIYGSTHRAYQHVPRVPDRGCPVDGGYRGHNMESLSVDYCGCHLMRVLCSLLGKVTIWKRLGTLMSQQKAKSFPYPTHHIISVAVKWNCPTSPSFIYV